MYNLWDSKILLDTNKQRIEALYILSRKVKKTIKGFIFWGDVVKYLMKEAYLVPCRSGGLDDLGAPVYFLDERPARRRNWTLVGCERSLQFHRHYYGDEPPRVEMCPRQLAADSDTPTLLKCCLLEFDIEDAGTQAVVPWGADLEMVEAALRRISRHVDYA